MDPMFFLKRFSGVAVIVCTFWAGATGQSVEELAARYPDKKAVILNKNTEVTIFMRDGQPVAETKVTSEMLVLDDKANGFYNRYSVYHGSFNELKDMEAYTKVPDGKGYSKIKIGQIKTESSRSNDVFYDDIKESKFDFPALSKGAVAYVSYTLISNDVHLLSPYYFKSYLPVINQKLTINCPSDIELAYIVRNDPDGKITRQDNRRGRSTVTTFRSTFTQESEHFDNAPDWSYYEPHIITRVTSFKNEQGKVVGFLKDVDELYKWYRDFIGGVDTAANPAVTAFVKDLVKNTSSDREKTRLIYQWVQHQIKYIAFENGLEGFVPRPAELVYERRFGDCKDMANLLRAMIRAAEIKAYICWIGTRKIPYEYQEIPLPIVDNHMIAAVELDGEWVFLDGTDANCIFGYPTAFIQGKQALVAVSPKEYKIMRVPEVNANSNKAVDSTFVTLTETGITGKISTNYYGYFAVDVNNSLFYKDEAGVVDYVRSRMGKASNKFTMLDHSISMLDSNNKSINISAGFEVPGYGKKIGKDWYINLALEKIFTNNSLIDTARRRIGIENDYKYTLSQYTILDVPNGYSVSYLPADFSVSNDILGFAIRYKKEANRVIALQEYTCKNLVMNVNQFAVWNESVRKILGNYKEQIVLHQL